MTKLLWHSNAPWAPTGYGQQTALFAPHLAQHYDMAMSSFYGLEGAPLTWEGIEVFPGMGQQFGDDILVQHAENFFEGNPRDGLVVTLMDVWVLDAQQMERMNVASWCPVDHEPVPPRVVDFFVQSNAIPIAMSRFGERMLGRLDPLYVPHGIDTEAYQPQDGPALREKYGWDKDAFIVGMVAANKGRPSRKCFVQAFQAFAKLLEKHDNAHLYLHTMLNPGLAGGEDIGGILTHLGIPDDRILAANQYRMNFAPFPHYAMAHIYSMMDVLLNPSMGEGFGIPIIEAQACGTPVIVTDCTAMTELCGAGWQVDHSSKYWTGLSSWQFVPDVDDIASALEECYGLRTRQRRQLADTARKHALTYALPQVLKEHMLPALRTAEKRFGSQAPVRIAPRRPNPMPTEPPKDFAIPEKGRAA